MPAPATLLSPKQLIDAAKAPLRAYGRKDWDAVKASITPDIVYDEVASHRKAQGLDLVMALWRGWATAFPDSEATFHSALVSGNTVVLEVTWKGTHTGPMEMPKGPIAATGKRIEFRACNVVEIAVEKGKVKLQRQYFDMGTILQQLGVTS
jgi:steroid delta-isomerase-like uncharacterized protein